MKEGRSYHSSSFRIILLTNQGILMFKNGYVITVDRWDLNLEVRTLELVWMDMTPSLTMMKRVLKRGTLMSRNIKY